MSHTRHVSASIHPTETVGGRFKRIILCCDGRWKDGFEPWLATSILRLSRIINHEDKRHHHTISQIVYYQSGIGGHDNSIYSKILQATIGSLASLAENIQEGYGFISQNYVPGDEIFLFGYSRGAYTARMIASLIGVIGVMDRQDMDHFPHLFIDLLKRGKSRDKAEIFELDARLARWTARDSLGNRRAHYDKDTFSVKFVGLFDTVGNFGLPVELTGSPEMTRLFGFSDLWLGEHIEYAIHALAINETRADWKPTKYEQTEGGRRKKQVLNQCWFAGCNNDVGGGYEDHDLSDVTLTWMIAHVGPFLSMDHKYMLSLLRPCYPWGEQPHHNPRTGFYELSETIVRRLPTSTDDVTHETLHSSVFRIPPHLKASIKSNHVIVAKLLHFEEDIRKQWPYVHGRYPPRDHKTEDRPDSHKLLANMAIHKRAELTHQAIHDIAQKETRRSWKTPDGEWTGRK
ncbi:hypothetical protein PILCRDRAFT_2444 [Piloderma croceum F 1598]|uniref:T6SS Phospholipase effector Tle1-like catalytic domain-containing protein n=1 Tax=Piloderma croceum (strain F 1598) TaxID=765440 RepID=A0A0C3BRQ2_PILCF|nr:hypothetical protein PILCRDRAFT_2444 [Piloderma croceum F 1598]